MRAAASLFTPFLTTLSSKPAEPSGSAVVFIAGVGLFFAPLYLGGNRPGAFLVLQLVSFALLAALVWMHRHRWLSNRTKQDKMVWILGAVMLLWLFAPLLQMLPLPHSWLSDIKGRQLGYEIVAFAGGELAAWNTISVNVRETERAWLLVFLPVAFFFAARSVSQRHLKTLLTVLAVIACLEAFLALVQAFGLRHQMPGTNATADGNGTYVNRNHLAGMLAMCLPMLLALVVVKSNAAARSERTHRDSREHSTAKIYWIAALILVGLGLIFSRSRGGLAFGGVAFALAVAFTAWRAETRGVWIVAAATMFFVLVCAGFLGASGVLSRFDSNVIASNWTSRAQIASATIKAGFDFLPFGAGLGTYEQAFRPYQVYYGDWFAQAHNDYAQLFFELGLLAVAIITLSFIAFVWQWQRLLTLSRRSDQTLIQMCAGASVIAILLHSFVDFNLQIPANAIYFGFLAGVFFRTDTESNPSRKSVRRI
jgi:O-antigen ligase